MAKGKGPKQRDVRGYDGRTDGQVRGQTPIAFRTYQKQVDIDLMDMIATPGRASAGQQQARGGDGAGRQPREVRRQANPPAAGGHRPPAAGNRQRRPSAPKPEPERGPKPAGAKQRKPVNRHRKAIVSIGAFAAVLVGGLVLALFVLLKVSTIEVVGDTVYQASDVISLCGYQRGDSLLFLSTKDKEQKLEKNMPYIEKASIKRKIPSTIEIHITATKPGGMIQNGNSYIAVDQNGKILEIATSPSPNFPVVTGIELENPAVGEEIIPRDLQKATVLLELLRGINQLEANKEMTEIDVSRLDNLMVCYQGRIDIELGAATDLAYKLERGIDIAGNQQYIQEQDVGVLRLGLITETGAAYYDRDAGKSLAAQLEGGPATGSNGALRVMKLRTSNEGRGEDIPDMPYTGKQTEDSGKENEGSVSSPESAASGESSQSSSESSESSEESWPESSVASQEGEGSFVEEITVEEGGGEGQLGGDPTEEGEIQV